MRKRRAAQEIRTLILDAAAREFEQFGYAGATTAAIARQAAVTEAQLFRYFRSKADLFRNSIFEPLNTRFEEFNASRLERILSDPAIDVEEQARAYIADLQGFIAGHRRMLVALVVAQSYDIESVQGLAKIGSLGAYFQHSVAMLGGRLDEKPRIDPRLLVRVSFAAVLAWVMFEDWLMPKDMASDEQISEALTDFVLHGISINNV